MGFKECFELGVDFMDMNTGYIYKIANYVNQKRMGLPALPLEVINSMGEFVGTVEDESLREMGLIA